MVPGETVLASHDAIARLILTQFNVEILTQSSNHFIGKTPFPEDINLSFSEDSVFLPSNFIYWKRQKEEWRRETIQQEDERIQTAFGIS